MKTRLKVFLAVLVVAAILAIARLAGGFLQGGFGRVFLPVEKVFWQAGKNIGGFFSGFFEASRLKKENERLFNQTFVLMEELQRFKTQKQENADLQDIMSSGLAKEFDLQIAQVVSQGQNDVLTINKGEKDGLSEKMTVLNQAGVLVGRIKKTFSRFSQIELITSALIVFDVNVQTASSSDVLGAWQGEGSGKAQLKLVAKDKEILAGEKIFTAALGGSFPKNILVGEIAEVKKTDAQPFQGGTAIPYFEKTNLDKVFVVTNFEGAQ
ncbi:MAG: rod shape-determining protein MreC [Patescibacteria group bacterium]|nr:rod shape-determining protein MreC [Patescibacteria group bacterium]